MLDKGTRLAFVAGIILCVFPGFFPLIALKDIAQLDYSVAATVVVLFAFYVVMFTLIEVPLVGFLTAPARTAELTTSFNVWLDRNRDASLSTPWPASASSRSCAASSSFSEARFLARHLPAVRYTK